MGKVKFFLIAVSLTMLCATLFRCAPKKENKSISVEQGGVIYRASILSANELAEQEANMLELSEQSLDSLASRYSPSTSIDLEINLVGLNNAEIASLGAVSEEDFNARYYVLHFRIHEFISLQVAEQEHQPVLTQATLDPSSNTMKIRLTFPISQDEFLATGSSLQYSDPFFSKEDITFNFN